MPRIPKGNFSGEVSGDIGSADISSAGAGAVGGAVANVGSRISNVANDLIERRARAQAKDYAYQKTLELDKSLSDLEIELQVEHPDGVGYAEAYTRRAEYIRKDLFTDSPNSFADEAYTNISQSKVANSVAQANSFENIRKLNVARARPELATDEHGKLQLERPNPFMAGDFIDTNVDHINTAVDIWSAPEREKLVRDSKLKVPEMYVDGTILSGDVRQMNDAIRHISAGGRLEKYLDDDTKQRLLFRLRSALKSGSERASVENKDFMNSWFLKARSSDLMSTEELNAGSTGVYRIFSDPNIDPAIKSNYGLRFAEGLAQQNFLKKALLDPTLATGEMFEKEMMAARTDMAEKLNKAGLSTLQTQFPGVADFGRREENRTAAIKAANSLIELRQERSMDVVEKLAPELANLRAQSKEPTASQEEYFKKATIAMAAIGEQDPNILVRDFKEMDLNRYRAARTPYDKANVIEAIHRQKGEFGSTYLTQLVNDKESGLPKELLLAAHVHDRPTIEFLTSLTKENKNEILKRFSASAEGESFNKVRDQVVNTFSDEKIVGKAFRQESAGGANNLINAMTDAVAFKAISDVNDQTHPNLKKSIDENTKALVLNNFMFLKDNKNNPVILPNKFRSPSGAVLPSSINSKAYVEVMSTPDMLEAYGVTVTPFMRDQVERVLQDEKAKEFKIRTGFSVEEARRLGKPVPKISEDDINKKAYRIMSQYTRVQPSADLNSVRLILEFPGQKPFQLYNDSGVIRRSFADIESNNLSGKEYDVMLAKKKKELD